MIAHSALSKSRQGGPYLVRGNIAEPFRESAIGTHEKLLAHTVDKALVVRDDDDASLPGVDCVDQRVETLPADEKTNMSQIQQQLFW